MRSRLRGDDGLGLTELAVAIVVLGIVLVGLFPLIVNSIGLAQSNAEVGQANRIVLSNINQARVQPLTAACPFTGEKTMALLDTSGTADFGGRLVLSCAASDPEGLTTVRVDVWHLRDATKVISTATTKVSAW